MDCSIEWNTLTPAQWQLRFAKIRRSNILQSYDYALAACPINRQRGRWGLIKLDGAEAGLVQILEAGVLGNIVHALHLDCGPLWFNGFGNEDDFIGFLKAFRKSFPKRLGRKIRFIPEIEETKNIKSVLHKHGFKRSASSQQQTSWIDLNLDEENLKQQPRKNWRNMLSRAEREGVTTIFDINPDHMKRLLHYYVLDKLAKDYGGVNVELLTALIKQLAPQGKVLLGRAMQGSDILGYGLFFMHGKSSTYQIGWTSQQGRSIGAQNKLLIDACMTLKAKGIEDLDLGGMNDDTAKGVKDFKMGMGGDHVVHAGLYIG